jgi:hypothetical protein
MMAGEHRSRSIIKVATTPLTAILLPGRRCLIPSLPRHRGGVTVGTTHPLGPPGLAKGLIALLVIQQVLKGNHRRRPSLTEVWESFSVPANPGRSEPPSAVWNPY